MEYTCGTCKYAHRVNLTRWACSGLGYLEMILQPECGCNQWEQAQSAKETEPAKKQYKAGDTFHDKDGDLCIYLGKGKCNDKVLCGSVDIDEKYIPLYHDEERDDEWVACLYKDQWLIMLFSRCNRQKE